MNFFFDDSRKHIGSDGAPELNAHGVVARAQKMLNIQVLLDPFEEQFDLPAAFVEGADRRRRQGD